MGDYGVLKYRVSKLVMTGRPECRWGWELTYTDEPGRRSVRRAADSGSEVWAWAWAWACPCLDGEALGQ